MENVSSTGRFSSVKIYNRNKFLLKVKKFLIIIIIFSHFKMYSVIQYGNGTSQIVLSKKIKKTDKYTVYKNYEVNILLENSELLVCVQYNLNYLYFSCCRK